MQSQLSPQETDRGGPRELNAARLDLFNQHWRDP